MRLPCELSQDWQSHIQHNPIAIHVTDILPGNRVTLATTEPKVGDCIKILQQQCRHKMKRTNNSDMIIAEQTEVSQMTANIHVCRNAKTTEMLAYQPFSAVPVKTRRVVTNTRHMYTRCTYIQQLQLLLPPPPLLQTQRNIILPCPFRRQICLLPQMDLERICSYEVYFTHHTCNVKTSALVSMTQSLYVLQFSETYI